MFPHPWWRTGRFDARTRCRGGPFWCGGWSKKPLTTCKNGLSSVTKQTNMFSALLTYSDFAHEFSVHPLVRGIYEFSVPKHSNCQNYSVVFFAGIAFILGVLLCSVIIWVEFPKYQLESKFCMCFCLSWWNRVKRLQHMLMLHLVQTKWRNLVNDFFLQQAFCIIWCSVCFKFISCTGNCVLG